MTDSPYVLLLVAADAADHELVGSLLDAERCEMHSVTGVGAALAAVLERPYDMVLLEASLACEATIRQLLEEDPRAQVIVFGDPSGAEQLRAAREHGAVDHMRKAALDADTLQRSIRYAGDHRRSVGRLQHDALHDPLTGLPNRTLFLDRLQQSLRRSRRSGPDSARRCCSSISTASRWSTTRSATRPAISCCKRSRCGWTPRCGPATPSRGSAATSSPCCSRT
jgi:PleD family two-component response regulator